MTAIQTRRWMFREKREDRYARRPARRLAQRIAGANASPHFSEAELAAADNLETNLAATVRSVDVRVMRNELSQSCEFVASIECTPLAEEQASAVICFDNRVHLLVAGGSGKTSVMVAQPAYAVAQLTNRRNPVPRPGPLPGDHSPLRSEAPRFDSEPAARRDSGESVGEQRLRRLDSWPSCGSPPDGERPFQRQPSSVNGATIIRDRGQQ